MDEISGLGRLTGVPPRVGVSDDLQAKLFSGLADPRRLALLRQLVPGPQTAGALARAAHLSPSGASNHLRCLLECGLVSVESDGRFNRYRLADVGVAGLLMGAEQLIVRVGAEIEACRNYGPPSRRALRRPAAGPMLREGQAAVRSRPRGRQRVPRAVGR